MVESGRVGCCVAELGTLWHLVNLLRAGQLASPDVCCVHQPPWGLTVLSNNQVVKQPARRLSVVLIWMRVSVDHAWLWKMLENLSCFTMSTKHRSCSWMPCKLLKVLREARLILYSTDIIDVTPEMLSLRHLIDKCYRWEMCDYFTQSTKITLKMTPFTADSDSTGQYMQARGYTLCSLPYTWLAGTGAHDDTLPGTCQKQDQVCETVRLLWTERCETHFCKDFLAIANFCRNQFNPTVSVQLI